jgi:hypothetical protein
LKEFTIGIDPDLDKSGVATIRNNQIVALDAMRFFDLIGFIEEHKATAVFHLEDVEYHKATFQRYIKDPKTKKQRALKPAEMYRVSQNVGQVKAIGRLISNYLKDSGAEYHLIKPLTGMVKKAKDDADFFNRLTNWDGRSNQDKRDAALLALFGKPPRKLRGE